MEKRNGNKQENEVSWMNAFSASLILKRIRGIENGNQIHI